ncbi:MAG: bifunctional phosphoribosylaminoimidazolecarboxamide formyltransferase/IMP cyclohydrolase [Bacteroidales bacterium]|jgi:phosphoribosylaminoimidazolecarboxamide formyltransferase/IMP cyclohydrolase|nr:bifunctional phosphoribosylaminoimidazolecarboxamide formyltransferase/IMP cyclohydrolase [Bacteroidales bacterium]
MIDSSKNIPIRNALISVYHKEGLEPVVEQLVKNGVHLYATGGTLAYLQELGANPIAVEDFTGYPSVLGGRVKTLHPKIFGGILARRDNPQDKEDLERLQAHFFDLVIVDLYPFSQTWASGASHEDIIEKIDIGGVSLIRAAAKNYENTLVMPDKELYGILLDLLQNRDCTSTLQERRIFATHAFRISCRYDSEIFQYFNMGMRLPVFSHCIDNQPIALRYGENPHQEAHFFGTTDSIPRQLHGKPISYNNLLDTQAALQLIAEFEETTVAILKHNNACGCASHSNITTAWKKALQADRLSAFGGVAVTNRPVTEALAKEMDKIFLEIVLAPSFHPEALTLLRDKKNRILLEYNPQISGPRKEFRSLLGGVIVQDTNTFVIEEGTGKVVTHKAPTKKQLQDLLFANKIVKHTRSNAIVLAANGVLLAAGMGQTSRIDALKQAITKAQENNLSLKGAVMASDAFFPFPDAVELAHQEGITAVIQPGGSVKDPLSIDFCNNHNMAMIHTGIRHFKH